VTVKNDNDVFGNDRNTYGNDYDIVKNQYDNETRKTSQRHDTIVSA